ncbi:hypothetical protein BHE74_00019997 [Ensete ventricosum]|nr:hypothetical protein BHE74_00019997 [Ensete ventricosum]
MNLSLSYSSFCCLVFYVLLSFIQYSLALQSTDACASYKDETMPPILVQERDDASSPCTGRGDASYPHTGMRRCLVSPRRDEATPRLPAGERGDASFPHGEKRRHVVLPLEDEASPLLPMRE